MVNDTSYADAELSGNTITFVSEIIQSPLSVDLRQCAFYTDTLSMDHGIVWFTDSILGVFTFDHVWTVVIVDINAHRLVHVFSIDFFLDIRDDLDLTRVEHDSIIDLSPEGDRWEGDVLDGEPYGYGCLYTPDSLLSYQGFMLNSVKTGYGMEYYTDMNTAQIHYEGTYVDGKYHGIGELIERDGTRTGVVLWLDNALESSNRSGFVGEWRKEDWVIGGRGDSDDDSDDDDSDDDDPTDNDDDNPTDNDDDNPIDNDDDNPIDNEDLDDLAQGGNRNVEDANQPVGDAAILNDYYGRDNDFHKLPSHPTNTFLTLSVTSLTLSKTNTFMGEEFPFQTFKQLETIHVGADCFEEVNRCVLEDMPFLKVALFDYGCYSRYQNAWEENIDSSRVFICRNCPKLVKLTMMASAFSDFYQCTIEDLPELQVVIFGTGKTMSNCFCQCPSFTIDNLPKLSILRFGGQSFYAVNRLQISSTLSSQG